MTKTPEQVEARRQLTKALGASAEAVAKLTKVLAILDWAEDNGVSLNGRLDRDALSDQVNNAKFLVQDAKDALNAVRFG